MKGYETGDTEREETSSISINISPVNPAKIGQDFADKYNEHKRTFLQESFPIALSLSLYFTLSRGISNKSGILITIKFEAL